MTYLSVTTIAFLSIKTQFDNLGDALINRELCRLAADRVSTYVDFSRAPRSFQKSMRVDEHPNLTTLRQRGYLALLSRMFRHRLAGHRCVFFLNPGGLGGRKKPLKSLLSAALYNVLLGMLRLLGVRICHVGMSFDVMGAPERLVAKWRRSLLSSFAVRDRLSAGYLHGIGMDADEVVPDLSFNLYRQARPAPGPRHAIAFSFRFDGKSDEQQIREVVRRVMDVCGPHCEYRFVVQVARDEAGMRRLHASCSAGAPHAALVVCHHDIDALSRHYMDCSAIYSNRLHALLLAAHAGASPYALVSRGAQPKIEGMFRDLGMEDRLCFIDGPGGNLPAPAPLELCRLQAECEALQSYFDKLLGSN